MKVVKEIFICSATRTPIGKYAGSLSSVRTDDLAAIPIRNLINQQQSLDLAAIDDVILGCSNQAGEDKQNVARVAALLAGLPVTVPACTINRMCGSGIDAVAMAHRAIAAGDADLIIAGGVESMSRSPLVISKPETAFCTEQKLSDSTMELRFENPKFANKFGTESMIATAENVAEKFNISRIDQDKFALRSQQRASIAQQKLLFADEIIPVSVQQNNQQIIVAKDENITKDNSLFRLRDLASLKNNGTVTAGNSAVMADGACALLVASIDAVYKYKLQPLTRIVASSCVGVEPKLMGIAPGPASLKLLTKNNLNISQVGIIEINEAYAAQVLAVTRMLGLKDNEFRVNSSGGAIALGNPLAMSGARLLTTASYKLVNTKQKYALCTMCIGAGQGIAMLLENARL